MDEPDESAIMKRERHLPPAKAQEWPPVIILNLFYSGLGIARDMAGCGVRVVGLSAHRHIYGNSTRRCDVRFSPNTQEQPEEFVEYLLQAAAELQGAVIFPTRDADVLFLDRFREELEPFFRLAVPPRQVLRRVIDKYALVEAAIAADVPVPRTTVVRTASDLAAAVVEVGFPCIVKPISSVHWRVANNWNLVGGQKAFRANNFAELQSEYERLARVRPELLLQEWIPGSVDQIVIWGGYVGDNSEPLAYFTARKIVQSPEDFGTGCVVKSEPIPDLPELTIRVWRALNYQGMAEVEFKRDTRDGKFKLIEINTRHWDWHQLGRASGVNLTWAAYCHLVGKFHTAPHRPIQHAKWVAEDALLMYIARSIYHREFHPLAVWTHVSGQRMYGIFDRNDPLPFLRYSIDLLPTFAKAVARQIFQRS